MEFLRLVPYLMSFSLVRHAFELKGMLFLVVRYQHLSVSQGPTNGFEAANNVIEEH